MKYLHIISVIALALFVSCQKDPLAEIEKGEWNHEKRILDIKFAGQVGTAEIETVDYSTGIITLQLASMLIDDMSKVTVESISTSYQSTCSVAKGGTIDFTVAEPTITVTSKAGEQRVYSLEMSEFTESLLGNYAIKSSMLYGGTGPEYGGDAVMDPNDKSWCWNTSGFGPGAEYDDYLEFTLTEILENGNTIGKCMHYGGADGKHWDCIFSGSQNKENPGVDIDLHKFYRMIPIGESTWERNYADGTLSFTDKDGTVTTSYFLDAGTYDVGNGKSVAVSDKAFKFNLSGVDDWTNIYQDYDKFVKRPRAYFILTDKVEAIPEASKTIGTEN